MSGSVWGCLGVSGGVLVHQGALVVSGGIWGVWRCLGVSEVSGSDGSGGDRYTISSMVCEGLGQTGIEKLQIQNQTTIKNINSV